MQANLAIAPGNSQVIYAMVAPGASASGEGSGAGGGGRGGRGGSIAFYKSTDGGENWFLATDDPRIAETGSQRHPPDTRPLVRIGGGDLPTITVDPKNDNVVYSCSTVFWRTEDGGLTWSAVRGAPGGDDYQKSWINPTNSEHHSAGERPGRGGLGQSRRIVEQLVHPAHRGDVSRDRR